MFTSARDGGIRVDACRAILSGKANDGGLYVPEKFPELTREFLESLSDSSLAERMARVLSLFVDIESDKLLEICEDAALPFEDELPLVAVEEGLYALDLTGGGSARADDISMRVFARLVSAAREKCDMSARPTALFAGSYAAARTLAYAFDGVSGVAAIAFVPSDKNALATRDLTSYADGKNVKVVGVKGDFEAKLEDMLSDDDFLKKFGELNGAILDCSPANIARVLPFVACFVSAYVDLVSTGRLRMGEKLNFALPAGDLCAAIAGIYAKRMGLPIDRLAIAFNENRDAMRLISDGKFKAPDKIRRTCAPEMDVAVPANLERLAFELSNGDPSRTAKAMREFEREGKLSLGDVTDSAAYDLLVAGWADEKDIAETLRDLFELDDAILDPHTAAAVSVLDDFRSEAEDSTPAVALQTASPYVYPLETLRLLGERESDPQKAIAMLELRTALEPPAFVASAADEAHDVDIICAQSMEDVVIDFAKSK